MHELRSAIIPPKDIRTGDKIVMSNRVWAQLDMLLTSDTITEAMDRAAVPIVFSDNIQICNASSFRFSF